MLYHHRRRRCRKSPSLLEAELQPCTKSDSMNGKKSYTRTAEENRALVCVCYSEMHNELHMNQNSLLMPVMWEFRSPWETFLPYVKRVIL